MKKVIAAVLCAVLLLPAVFVGAYAETYEEDFGVVMMSAVVTLDYMDRDYNASYIYETVCDILYPYEDAEKLEFKPITVSAKVFEDTVNAHFVCGEGMLEELRKHPTAEYDDVEKTYSVIFRGGMGGSLAARRYVGFVDNGNDTYDLYFEHLTYDFLPGDLDGTLEELDWPPEYEYGGKVYQNGPDGYYRIASYDRYGKKYTVDYKNNLTRLISVSTFTEADYPDAFSTRKYTYDIPASVHVLSADSFEDGTKLTISELKKGEKYKKAEEAVSHVSGKYAIYDFSAEKGGKKVQPNGDFVFEIDVPDGFGEDLSVYYVSDDGKLEKLDSELSSRTSWNENGEYKILTLVVTVKHFSTYAIVDNKTAPTVTEAVTTEAVTTEAGNDETVTTEAETAAIADTDAKDTARYDVAGDTENTAEPLPDDRTDGEDKGKKSYGTEPDEKTGKNKKSPVGLIIGIAAAVIAAAVCVFAAVRRKAKK